MPFEALLANAPMDYIRRHLGKELCGLLDLIEGGTAGDSRLRAVASIAIDTELLVADEDERATLIGLVPAPKQGELAQRLGSPGDRRPLEYLYSLKWTPAERRAPPSMKNTSIPALKRNIMRRNGSASARTSGAALTRSSSHGERKYPSGAMTSTDSPIAVMKA